VALPLLAAAYGWLELARHAPGPRLAQALPLHAAGHADAVSAPLVVAVFALAFAALALLAPPARLRVWQVALLRGAGSLALALVLAAASIHLVEQAQTGLSLGAALRAPAPWAIGAASAVGTWLGLDARRRLRSEGPA
jgi:hypothetical protein